MSSANIVAEIQFKLLTERVLSADIEKVGEWPSGGRFLVQNPLGTRPGLGTQPRYEAPSDLQVEHVQKRSD